MITESPTDLMKEARAGQEFVHAHISELARMVGEYHGPSFNTRSSEPYNPKNKSFSFAGLYVPKCVFGDPRFRVRSKRGEAQRQIALASTHGLNRVAKETRLKRQMETAVLDMLFSFGFYQVAMQGRPSPVPPLSREAGVENASLPYCARVPQDRMVIDYDAGALENARLFGHELRWDYPQLKRLAEANPDDWNMDIVSQLKDSANTTQWADSPLSKDRDRGTYQSERNYVSAYSLWVPEMEHEDAQEGDHGTLFTVVEWGARGSGSKTQAHLKPPRPFFGHPMGPYASFGVYDVPGDPLALGPLTAFDKSMAELSAVWDAMQERAESFQRRVVAPSEIADELRDSPDQSVIGVMGRDFDSRQVAQIETGGLSQHDVAWAQLQEGSVDQGLALSDPLQGKTNAGATATADSLAQASHEIRSSRIIDRYSDGLVGVAERMLYLMTKEDSIVFPLGPEASKELGMSEAWFEPALLGKDELSWGDLELMVEPLTIGRMAKAERQALADKRLAMVLQAGQAQATMPFLRMTDELRRWGEAHDMFDVHESIDEEALAQFVQGMQGNPQIPDAAPMFKGFLNGGASIVQQPSGGPGGNFGALGKEERAMNMLGGSSPSAQPQQQIQTIGGGQ